MTREHKFRAWDKRLSIMIYQLPDGYRLNLNGRIEVIGEGLSTFRISDEFILMEYFGFGDWWEDDILQDESGYRFRIVYVEKLMRFGLLSLSDTLENYYFIKEDYSDSELQKIGDIHTDPELLQ